MNYAELNNKSAARYAKEYAIQQMGKIDINASIDDQITYYIKYYNWKSYIYVRLAVDA